MKKKYVILDHTSNTGKEYLDENGANCIEEVAVVFESEKDAETWLNNLAQSGAKHFDRWEHWATINEAWG